MTPLRAAVRAGARLLAAAGIASAEVDAAELAAHVLGVDAGQVRRLMVLGGALPASFEQRYAAELAERARRVPLQHLTGQAHFRRLTLRVGPGVFVPRPETEALVELAVAELERLGAPARVVDLCTGSAAIALAVKDERPEAVVRAVELAEPALAWARLNRDRLGLDVELVAADATRPCLPDWAGSVDLVTVNPPYIPANAVPVDPEVRDHDPELALYGGSPDGLAIPLRVAAVAAGLLRPGGLLLMEHADTQGETLPAALREAGPWSEIADHLDLTGRPRVTSARRGGSSPGSRDGSVAGSSDGSEAGSSGRPVPGLRPDERPSDAV